MSILFNASEFNKTLKIEFFKQLYQISKNYQLMYLYDYFKAPERLISLEDIDVLSLLGYYEFALQIAQQNQK